MAATCIDQASVAGLIHVRADCNRGDGTAAEWAHLSREYEWNLSLANIPQEVGCRQLDLCTRDLRQRQVAPILLLLEHRRVQYLHQIGQDLQVENMSDAVRIDEKVQISVTKINSQQPKVESRTWSGRTTAISNHSV